MPAIRLIKIAVTYLAIVFLFISCTKSDFLNTVGSSRYQVIKSLDDAQQLLDNEILMNVTPTLPELSADDYYITDSKLATLNIRDKSAYTWAKDIFGDQVNDDDWTIPYQQVLYANTVLDYLSEKNVSDSEKVKFNYLKGNALFKRAYAFYNLAQVFMQPYDSATAAVELGIPLRLQADINEISTRSTMQQTYDRIIADLQEARLLLPLAVDAVNRNRSSVPAAMAMLARTYISMRNYEKAFDYSDSCLQQYNTLMDYSTLSAGTLPFNRLNEETIYQARFRSGTDILLGFAAKICIIDSTLYKSYATDDLRRSAFFVVASDGFPYTKGSYYGALSPFSGLATDEQYLIRAECLARTNKLQLAMSDLNTLLQKRWKIGSFIPLTAQSAAEALQFILSERRKELVFRGLRWTDIRRLNKEEVAITLTRRINGQVYTLLPNDKRYALPIPRDVINKTGMPQNPR
jgi:starch-binding outer membrane protein, SusD/RagB family